MSAHKRKVYLINKPFQLKIIGYFTALSLINVSVFYTAIYTFFENFKQKGLNAGLPSRHVFFVFIEEQFLQMSIIFLFTAIITSIFLVIAGLLLSHKVAGPMYRLREHFKSIKQASELKQVTFRDKDFFRDVELHFNEMVTKIKG